MDRRVSNLGHAFKDLEWGSGRGNHGEGALGPCGGNVYLDVVLLNLATSLHDSARLGLVECFDRYGAAFLRRLQCRCLRSRSRGELPRHNHA